MKVEWTLDGSSTNVRQTSDRSSTEIRRTSDESPTKVRRKLEEKSIDDDATNNTADATMLQSPLSSVAMADVTRQPQHCEACVSCAMMARSNTKNIALQLKALWRYKSRRHCNSEHCGTANHNNIALRALWHCNSRCKQIFFWFFWFFLFGRIFNRLLYVWETKKKARKRKGKKAFKPIWSCSSQLLYCWFSSDPGAIGWFSTTQVPSSKLLPIVATPTSREKNSRIQNQKKIYRF